MQSYMQLTQKYRCRCTSNLCKTYIKIIHIQ